MAEAKKMEKKTKKEDVLDDVKDTKKKTTTKAKTTAKSTKTTSKKSTSSTGIKKAAKKESDKDTKATKSTKTKTVKKVAEDKKEEKVKEVKTKATKTKKVSKDEVAKSDAKTKTKKQTEKSKVKVEKIPSGVVVKKDDKEVVSKIKIPKVVSVDTKKKTTSKKLNTDKIEDNKNDIEENNKLVVKKEQTIIEKIKSFLKKIIEMQKEAKNEVTEEIDTIKKSAKIKKAEKAKKEKILELEEETSETFLLEYYDLPYRYNETVVKILAQTPRRIFVYWDISDADREKYIKTFGENFFTDTYPVLLLYNEDKKYIKEIVVNDFANSWYIDIDNPKTKYSVQLGRKFRNKPQIINIAKMIEEKIDLQNDYLPMVHSNKIEAPNDRVLFENFTKNVKFRNVKTGQETVKDLGLFVEKISKAYDAPSFKEIFKEIVPSDAISDDRFDFDNPTSGNPTSTFK